MRVDESKIHGVLVSIKLVFFTEMLEIRKDSATNVVFCCHEKHRRLVLGISLWMPKMPSGLERVIRHTGAEKDPD
jgi:hypothetical protein